MSKEAMTLALEALKSISEMVDYEGNGFKLEYEIKALEEALAKQEQGEPVAWMKEGWGSDCGPYIEFYCDDEMGWRDRKEWTPLYTKPQPSQKPWVGLTEKERNDIEDWCEMMIGKPAFDSIEAKLKEKNT